MPDNETKKSSTQEEYRLKYKIGFIDIFLHILYRLPLRLVTFVIVAILFTIGFNLIERKEFSVNFFLLDFFSNLGFLLLIYLTLSAVISYKSYKLNQWSEGLKVSKDILEFEMKNSKIKAN